MIQIFPSLSLSLDFVFSYVAAFLFDDVILNFNYCGTLGKSFSFEVYWKN